MFTNYLIIAFRNILRNAKSHALLNIIGLSVALACAVLISMFVYDEHSYDRYHNNADRIYRVVHNWKANDAITPWARTSAPLGPTLAEVYDEVEQMTRVRKNPRTDLLAYEDKRFNEDRLYFADSTFFDVFSFKLKKGNPETALQHINSILMTEEKARNYFGDQDPIGKIIRYNNSIELMVTGILEEVPENSHFVFEILVTFGTLEQIIGENRTRHWAWFDHHTYLLMSKEADMAAFKASLPQFMRDHAPEWLPERMELFVQPLTSIHLHSHLKDELSMNSKPQYSNILLTVGLFIIIMASINFMNLATARYTTRSVEIGVRKAMGAQRSQLVKFYLTESVLISFLSGLMAIIIIAGILGWFNELSGKSFTLNRDNNAIFLAGLIIVSVLVGLLSGSYPALFLSGLKPVMVLKGKFVPGSFIAGFRKSLVVFQFSLSLIMIISTLVVSYQLNYFKTTTFGFDKDHVLIIPIKDRSQNERYQTLSNVIHNHPSIKEVSFASSTPGTNNNMTFAFKVEGTEGDVESVPTFFIDENFIPLYDLTIMEGKNITSQFSPDSSRYVILNKSAAELFDLDQPIGARLRGSFSGIVIGVIEDFNIKSLHNNLDPLILSKNPRWFRYISVKIKSGQTKDAIDYLTKTWASIYGGHVLEFAFLDDNINSQYLAEEKLGKIFTFFSMIALVIATLGLIALGSFTVEKRFKEIGIRKALGSSSGKILGLLYWDFVKLLGLAILISWPLSYWIMTDWLEAFAFRIRISWYIYLIPFLIISIVLALSIGYQVTRASFSNPVNALRDE